MPELAKPVFHVQVRTLVEFALRCGDLAAESGFVGTNRALAGIRGHQKIQRSRPAGYEKEVPLSWELEAPNFVLRIEGRIDGIQSLANGVVLEEIKTVTGAWDHATDPLHWAQVRMYAAIYCRQNHCPSITLKLVYLNLDSGQITEFTDNPERDTLDAFLSATTEVYVNWMMEQHQWGVLRDQSISTLNFPFEKYRAGQRELAIAAYRALTKGDRLFAEAPTGIGKTVSVLFPAIKALGENKLERVFYLTARTSGRAVAEKATDDLRQSGLRLRSLTLTAKEKICVQAGKPCDPAECPLARGYYDRVRNAMRRTLARERITRSVLEEVSRECQVCPFELSLDVSTWVDLVICDYNYVFDPKTYLRRHFEQQGDYAFLVDEAHNLVDRGREMFSAELVAEDVREVRRILAKALPKCARALSKVATALRDCTGRAEIDPASETDGEVPELSLFPIGSPTNGSNGEAAGRERRSSSSNDTAENTGGLLRPGASEFYPARNGLYVSRQLPETLIAAIDAALKETEAWLTRNEPAPFRERLLELFFILHSFRRTADLYDSRFATLATPGRFARVKLFCLDPSHLLGQAFDRGRSAVLFSATLSPVDYYRDLLGGSEQDKVLQLASPFPPENLSVLVQDRIRTHYKARDLTLSQVAQAIATVVKAKRGNYMVYLPSYAYLQNLRSTFVALCPGVEVLVQEPGMSEEQRESFLGAFRVKRTETLVGFAVMGGVFGEGIDLVGECLIGAIIVGVGLPQLCIERDLIAAHFQAVNGAGFEYAYTFPGMNRVLQATGRVIRSESDCGIVLLIDTRFSEGRYRRLFPPWWQPSRASNHQWMQATLEDFWLKQPAETIGPEKA